MCYHKMHLIQREKAIDVQSQTSYMIPVSFMKISDSIKLIRLIWISVYFNTNNLDLNQTSTQAQHSSMLINSFVCCPSSDIPAEMAATKKIYVVWKHHMKYRNDFYLRKSVSSRLTNFCYSIIKLRSRQAKFGITHKWTDGETEAQTLTKQKWQ